MTHEHGLLEAAELMNSADIPTSTRVLICGQMRTQTVSVQSVLEGQQADEQYQRFLEFAQSPDHPDWSRSTDSCLRFGGQLWIPSVAELRDEILQEAHRSRFTVHPGRTKMYADMRRLFWWPVMKTDVSDYVRACEICQRVKAEHRRPEGLLQPLLIPQWKWEHIAMDFIYGLPRSQRGHDSIWVIVDRLTKSAPFLPVSTTHMVDKLAALYEREIVRLHGVPLSIMSDRGS
ncbi:hypothetical protein Scep_009674 [Stephania cephalantha]|uniref:Integrase catalytic domain-containing protein n=1 Tax=Stephania cephalantha TaxID=152367 RepID=A0AAP0JTL3_9MAGN